MVIDSGDGAGGGPDAGLDPVPLTDTVRMDFWVPPEPSHGAAGAAESFTFAPPDAVPAAALADDAVLASTSAPEHSVASVAAASVAQAATQTPPLVDAGSAQDPAGAVVLSAGEQADDPLKTTVVGFVVNVGNTATNPLDVAHATAEPSVTAPATTDEASATNPAAGIGGLADSAVAMTVLKSEQSAPAPPATKPASRVPVRAGISPTIFVIVVSYASAMTLACLYLAFQLLSNQRTHDLPDLAPPIPKDKKKVISLIYLSPDQELPPANVLKVGESRRFGSLKVTPLRVTRGPLEFEYYEPAADQHKDAEGPVLKLHLRFENVSHDQEFIPLDSKLVFYREVDRKTYGLFKANNFVCNVADRKKLAKHVLVFDLTPNGNWLVKGENLDRDFEPGQIMETFIPTTPDQIESLSGDLVWRVHFRKGYNRQSYRGVTTLIEVLFKDSDIVDEEPAPAGPAPRGDEPEVPAKEKPALKDA